MYQGEAIYHLPESQYNSHSTLDMPLIKAYRCMPPACLSVCPWRMYTSGDALLVLSLWCTDCCIYKSHGPHVLTQSPILGKHAQLRGKMRLSLAYYVIIGKILKFSEPQLMHLQYANKFNYFATFVKYLVCAGCCARTRD